MYYDNPQLGEFVRWLTATPASQWLQAVSSNAPVLLATVQTLHLLGMSVVIAANGFVAIGLLGGLRSGEALPVLAGKVIPWVLTALGVMLVTGVILIVRWPSRILLSATFLPKLVLVSCGTALLLHVARTLNRHQAGVVAGTRTAKVLAMLLLLVWTAAVVAARWIPFA